MEPSALRILLVEDSSADAKLINDALRQAGLAAVYQTVIDELQFRSALEDLPDVILCDWNLPQFDALTALEISRTSAPETPFIIVSGSIGEESAVLAMKQGASDYLLKDRLARLGQSIRHAMIQRNLRIAERRMRDALRTSEAQYRALADSIPQIVWIAEQSGQIEYVNQRALDYTGLTRQQLAGSSVHQVIHPDDLERFRRCRDDSRQSGVPLDIEVRLRRHDGIYRWHMDRYVPVRDAIGSVVRWFGTSTDIHDQKIATEAMARDAQILASVRDSVVVTDTRGGIVSWNKGAASLFGWSEQDMLSTNYRERLPQSVADEIMDVIESKDVAREWYGEYETVRSDGKTIWVHSRVCSIHSASEDSGLVLILSWDLSDRKRAEVSLAAVMQSVGDAIITIDQQGVIRSINEAASTATGYSSDELLDHELAMIMPEGLQSHFLGSLQDFVHTGKSNVIGVGREVPVRRKDGTVFPAELSVTAYRFDGELRFSGVLRDITARKRLEEQFHHAQRMEAIGRLAGGIAHDFNNLLTVINGHADFILPRTRPGQEVRSSLEAIRDAGQRAAGLTSQLLAFSRKAIVAPKIVDLNEVILQSEKLLRRLIGEDILLATVLCDSSPRVQIDPNQLDQVVMNLAVNARDAMPAGGRLIFETHRREIREPAASDGALAPGKYVELVVRDSGCGMSDEVRLRIFEPFFTTKGPGKGTGLGLSVVHGVIKQAGGHVFAESQPNCGTTFRILMPEVDPPQVAGASDHPTAIRRGSETIILVEDEPAVRQLCRIVLENQGYSVLSAEDGEHAIEAVRRYAGPVHILITDVVMPGMSGHELASVIRTEAPSLKVLYISGYTDDEVLRRGVRDASDSFLQKPFTPLGLARKVRECLDAATA